MTAVTFSYRLGLLCEMDSLVSVMEDSGVRVEENTDRGSFTINVENAERHLQWLENETEKHAESIIQHAMETNKKCMGVDDIADKTGTAGIRRTSGLF